jgi:lysozyme
MARKVSAKGRRLIEQWEGRELEAYPDPATGGEPWTIGVGHTGGVKKGDTITEAECDALFDEDLEEHDINPLLGDAPTSQDQFDAMTALAFNIGLTRFANSTVLKRHKMQNHLGAANAFLLWHYAAGKPMKGLMRRREAERKLYMGRA